MTIRTGIFQLMMIALAGVTPAFAQWEGYPTPGIPRTPDGKVNLNAPLPRTADGKPDLSESGKLPVAHSTSL
jgi:hypothetical protein